VSLNESSETFGTYHICLLKFFYSVCVYYHINVSGSKTENAHSTKKIDHNVF